MKLTVLLKEKETEKTSQTAAEEDVLEILLDEISPTVQVIPTGLSVTHTYTHAPLFS